MKIKTYATLLFVCRTVSAFWDVGTTTIDPAAYRWDQASVRRSRFRWQRTETTWRGTWFRYWDWNEINFRRRLYVIAGVSIDFINLTTAAILNKRTLLTSANPFDPYMHRARELRIWALGRTGLEFTPWRYRVWRLTRMFPKSLNPEHCHGPYCYHQPRHDVMVIHTKDQMYVELTTSNHYHYATKTFMCGKKQILNLGVFWFGGSGYEYIQHVLENYKVFYALSNVDYIRDCSKYLPKWWGKFICVVNHEAFPCIQSGGPLFDDNYVVGVGCFEIRYNDDRIMAFSDMRYYHDWVNYYGTISPGEYYEYAYPQWGMTYGVMTDSGGNSPLIGFWDINDKGMFPLG